MKTFSVVFDQPSHILGWCEEKEKDVMIETPTTTVVFEVNAQDCLKLEIEKRYPKIPILSIKEY